MLFGKPSALPELDALEVPLLGRPRDHQRLRIFDASCLWASAAVQEPISVLMHYDYNLFGNVILRSVCVWVRDGFSDSITVDAPAVGQTDWRRARIRPESGRSAGEKALFSFLDAVEAFGWRLGRDKKADLTMMRSTRHIEGLTSHQTMMVLGAVARQIKKDR